MAVALVTTLGILFFQIIPISASPYLVVINAQDKTAEAEILSIIKGYSPHYRIDSKI